MMRFAAQIRTVAIRGARLFLRALRHLWRIRRYMTAVKLANMAFVKLQRCLKREVVFGMPYSVMIEPTNICNTECQLCPTGEGHAGRAKGFMSWDLYRQFIDDCSKWIYTLSLFMWGDPLIAKNIYRMIDYAHKAGIWTGLSSNLHSFHPDRGDAVTMVESGLDELSCSLHGASQATFAIYQPGKDFRKTIDKIKCLIETQKSMGKNTPKVRIIFVVTRLNEHEIPAFKKLAHELKCEYAFSTPSLNMRFLNTASP
jgi:MoaA/NifB/PqqE/SkfB family radical SAM enzyme